MMERRFISVAMALSILTLAVSPVLAAKQVYTLALDQPAPVVSPVTFTATRSVVRNDAKIAWINVYCHDAGHVTIYDTEYPVQWGTFDSLIGHSASFDLTPGSDHCWAALVTSIDYEPRHGDPVLFFRVAP